MIEQIKSLIIVWTDKSRTQYNSQEDVERFIRRMAIEILEKAEA
jgi:hypothetical protein